MALKLFGRPVFRRAGDWHALSGYVAACAASMFDRVTPAASVHAQLPVPQSGGSMTWVMLMIVKQMTVSCCTARAAHARADSALDLQIDTECDFGYEWSWHDEECRPMAGFDVNTCPHVKVEPHVLPCCGPGVCKCTAYTAAWVILRAARSEQFCSLAHVGICRHPTQAAGVRLVWRLHAGTVCPSTCAGAADVSPVSDLRLCRLNEAKGCCRTTPM